MKSRPSADLHHPLVLGKAHNCDQVWLTGANVPSSGGAFRNTVSADQLIAEVQGEFTRFPSLEMAIDGFSLAWSRDGIQIPAERNVKSIFERLFGEETGGKGCRSTSFESAWKYSRRCARRRPEA